MANRVSAAASFTLSYSVHAPVRGLLFSALLLINSRCWIVGSALASFAVHRYGKSVAGTALERVPETDVPAEVRWLRVFTIPVSAGLAAVEGAFNVFVAEHPGSEWYFANVYDPADGVTPLEWWESK